MLQQEEQRALKKIQETRKKTKEIQELQERNDEKYRNRLLQVEKIKIQSGTMCFIEKRRGSYFWWCVLKSFTGNRIRM